MVRLVILKYTAVSFYAHNISDMYIIYIDIHMYIFNNLHIHTSQ